MSGYPWSEVRSLPVASYVMVVGADSRVGLATLDDPITPAARRALAGTDTAADRDAIARWLDDVVPAPAGQLELFRAAA